MIRRVGVVALCALGLAAGCDREEPEAGFVDLTVEFDRGSVLVVSEADTIPVAVDLAVSEPQRRLGLMNRPSLPAGEGMIFLFPEEQPAENTFWMYNTLIPLSIAFLDEDGRIGSIRDMEPCRSPMPQACPNYAAGVPFRAALEVNRGFFEEHGVQVGDRVILENDES